MCLVLLSWRQHADFPLILASNRDEFYHRPSLPLHFWEQHPSVAGGLDERAGGSWLAMHTSGRLATVTNFRSGLRENPAAPSRGALVKDYVAGSDPPGEYLARLAARGTSFNGFNILAADRQACWHYSNRGGPPRLLEPALYGLSNALLDAPWPKVVKAKNAFQQLIAGRRWSADEFFLLLSDETPAIDDALPDTGVGIDLERKLSPIFIKSPGYGTRVSTVITVSADNHVVFAERTYHPQDSAFTSHQLEFDLTS